MPETLIKRILTIASIVFIGVALVFVALIVQSNNELKEATESNTLTYNQKSSELEALKQVSPTDVTVVKTAISSAADAGNAMAKYQTAYSELDAVKQEAAFMRNVEDIGALLDEKSQNKRVPWYGDDDTDFTWRFCSTYTFSGDSVPVVWLCENNETKEVYAYATGTYNASTGLFSNVDYGLTYAGNEHIPATSSAVSTSDGSASAESASSSSASASASAVSSSASSSAASEVEE